MNEKMIENPASRQYDWLDSMTGWDWQATYAW